MPISIQIDIGIPEIQRPSISIMSLIMIIDARRSLPVWKPHLLQDAAPYLHKPFIIRLIQMSKLYSPAFTRLPIDIDEIVMGTIRIAGSEHIAVPYLGYPHNHFPPPIEETMNLIRRNGAFITHHRPIRTYLTATNKNLNRSGSMNESSAMQTIAPTTQTMMEPGILPVSQLMKPSQKEFPE